MNKAQGFTLIELMVVVAIIGLLATIAMATYSTYTTTAANRACMFEMRHYVTEVMIALNTPGEEAPLPTNVSACREIEPAVDLTTPVTGEPQLPGDRPIRCDIPTTSCEFVE